MKGVSFASVCVCGRFDDVLHPNGQQVTAAIFSLHLSTYVCVSLCVCVCVFCIQKGPEVQGAHQKELAVSSISAGE